MKILVINGVNLNMLGVREPEIYGNQSMESYFSALQNKYPTINLEYYQSNVEGEIINKLQEVGFDYNGILLNAGGYTHTSVAIRDAISAIKTPVLEIHISNIYARESFRQISLLSEVCKGTISGLGMDGYLLGIEYFAKK